MSSCEKTRVEKRTALEILGATEERIADIAAGVGLPQRDMRIIAEALAEEIAQDIVDTADLKNWSESDVSLAIGRVLKKRLAVEE